ncbi:TfuA-like protein [Legionella sp. W05-934-2]|uniref:TfuA-like protein n=1 Tax=Legionella sp. W05-934-2 TaxID=1198649 RepID=UPI003462CEBF
MTNQLTIVYSGPTINQTQVKSLLPDAYWHDPIQCGDVIKAMRIGAKRLIIIDGFFEHKASVWHKEILLAMQHGIEVIGASSIGVLRACELHSYGMIGIGEIFHWYQQGLIDSDDEVTVVHYPAEADYLPASDALVNIRKTLQYGLESQILTQNDHDQLLTKAKQTFYRQRNWHQLLENSQLPDMTVLWLKKNYQDIKQADAIAALHYAASHPAMAPKPFELCHNQYLNKQIHVMNTQPFSQAFDWLPVEEKRTIAWFDQGHEAKELVTHLAKLCDMTTMLFNPIDNIENIDLTHFGHFLKESTDPDFHQLIEFINLQIANGALDLKIVEKFYPYLRLLFFNPRKKTSEHTQSALVLFSVLWVILNQHADAAGIYCEDEKIKEYTNDLLQKIGQPSLGSLNAFIYQYQYEKKLFIKLCYEGARFRYLFNYFIGQGLAKRKVFKPKNWLWTVIEVFLHKKQEF